MTMLESVLIANRGEIACRIIRTCRRLGVRSVAVYSEADRHSPHVKLADEAVLLGPAEAARSYLDAHAILAAAAKTNAAAIHPGYGFLSEKTVLAELCDTEKRVWIGPRAEVIARMGSKTEAKKIAYGAGVALVPGYHGDDQSPEHLSIHAARIGYPVLIKASAGGGGRGMRKVARAEDFLPQLTLAKTEALRAFGDDRVLLERLIQKPRHLEVQLAGDRHGNLIHLYERECSVQRNYQKVIEEAPAAFLSDATRSKLFEYALRLGRAIRYDSLGTVEFVLEEGTDEPYFLEMNTRLQVEHPVTEEVTGLDLVELQLRIASGEPLPLTQDDVNVRGWAIEARINCENPARDYRPELGEVSLYRTPEDRAELRVESGVTIGTNVGPYYDSMVAKIIGRGVTRAAAARSLRAGLVDFEALGIGTNQLFVRDLLAHPNFLDRPLTTGFIGDTYPDGWSPDARISDAAKIAAAFCHLHDWTSPAIATKTPWTARTGFRNASKTGNHGWARFVVTLDGESSSVWLKPSGAGWSARLGDREVVVALSFDGASHVVVDDLRFGFVGQTYISYQGMRFASSIVSELHDRASVAVAAGAKSGTILAALPGLVTSVGVAVGQAVKAGDLVVVMESMKLLFSLPSPIDGVVTAVFCTPGETVANAQKLVEIAPPQVTPQVPTVQSSLPVAP